jgi:hypothetical protein
MCEGKGERTQKVEIRIHAVGMAYSWKHFVEEISAMLEDYPGCEIELKILFVDHAYLSSLDFANIEENWAEESKDRLKDAQDLLSAAPKLRGRLSFSVKTYSGLPFWHGILVNDEHLFIGRTNFKFETTRPQLSVGRNRYRYFNTTDNEDRIARFHNWHRYHYEFDKTTRTICTTHTTVP